MVTIKEIAKTVGVSSATVSRVLNYDPTLSISAPKRQAIIETAEALNYLTPRNRARAAAASMSLNGGVNRIAVVHVLNPADELADPYYVGVRLGIEHRCRELRLDMVKVSAEDAMANPDVMTGATGVVAVGIGADHMVAWLRQKNLPLVFADVAPFLDQHDRVESDLQHATRQLLDDLLASGYRRIAFVAGNDRKTGEGCDLPDRRLVAFRSWMVEHNLYDPDFVLEGRLCFETGYEATKRLLDAPRRPELILCANDNVAIGAYRAINERGLTIPGDIGVVGYNDIPAAQFLSPPLTTVKIHSERIGEAAVDLLVEQLAGRDYFKRLFISTELIWRDSCRAPRDGG